MQYGEKLRQLRSEAKLTQPQLADQAGVEQSYVSKLENEISVPSGEVLDQILQALGTDLFSFLDAIEPRSQRKLRQIPEVLRYLKQYQVDMIKNRKRWLLACVGLCVFGGGLVVSGLQGAFFPERMFQYISEGVVLPGESNEIFSNWTESVDRSRDGMPWDKREQRRKEMYQKLSEVYRLTREFKGTTFNTPVTGGSRTFRLTRDETILRWENKLLQVLGVMFLIAGIAGFVIERRGNSSGN